MNISRVVTLLLALFLPIAVVGIVYAISSVVQDPVGDAAPPYSDIVKGKVTEQRGKESLYFLMELAGSVPEKPPESALIWVWALDTDETIRQEFTLAIAWSNGAFWGYLADLRPLPPVITPVEFDISGATVKAFVRLSEIGAPLSFRWLAYTKSQPGVPDFAPDSGWVNWTR